MTVDNRGRKIMLSSVTLSFDCNYSEETTTLSGITATNRLFWNDNGEEDTRKKQNIPLSLIDQAISEGKLTVDHIAKMTEVFDVVHRMANSEVVHD